MIGKTYVVNLRKAVYDVYIGRPGKGKDGYFGNPIVKGEVCLVCMLTHTDPESTVDCYKEYFDYRIREEPDFRKRVHELAGKALGCFCKPNRCHGDVIAEYLNRLYFSEVK